MLCLWEKGPTTALAMAMAMVRVTDGEVSLVVLEKALLGFPSYIMFLITGLPEPQPRRRVLRIIQTVGPPATHRKHGDVQ